MDRLRYYLLGRPLLALSWVVWHAAEWWVYRAYGAHRWSTAVLNLAERWGRLSRFELERKHGEQPAEGR